MNQSLKYSPLQMAIHWVSALLVIIAIVLPLFRCSLSPLIGGMGNLFLIHKSLGTIIFIITLWRIAVILKQGVPEVLEKHEKLQRIVSKAVQGIIYILLLVLPLSGYLMSDRGVSLFGLFTIPGITLPESLQQFLHTTHIISAYLLIALVLLHSAAALYHYIWRKDRVLQSMLPGK